MLMKVSAFAAVGLACLIDTAAMAQDSSATESSAAVTPSAVPVTPPVCVPKGTPIVVEMVDLVSSDIAMRDEMFNLKLSEPVMLNGVIVIPSGTPGKGQVVDAAKAGTGGKPGKLVLAARYLEFGGQHIPIKALNLDLDATDESGTAIMLDAVVGGMVGGMVSGGPMVAPPGMRGTAKLGVDFTPGQLADPTSNPPAPQTNTGEEPSPALQTGSAEAQPSAPQSIQ